MVETIITLIKAAKYAGVSPSLLVAICMTESNLRNVDVMDDGGSPSYGICQVKLETAKWMGEIYNKSLLKDLKESDIRKPYRNAKAAAWYLKYQIERYSGDYCKAVAAYNAGSFRESIKKPGLPFNWRYLTKVKENGDYVVKQKLRCLGNLKPLKNLSG
jgi:soluble lytic murein transglycosylase-like protein